MKDFLKYILSEVKSKRLTKKEAAHLISQYQNGGTQGNNNFLHPLLHQNTSDLSEQRFSSTLKGHEFFLADHRVMGRKVLPGVAYLEMVREAIQYAAGALEEGRMGVTLENVVWIRPVVLERDEEKLLHIGVYPEENGNISFRIYARLDNEEEDVVYCEGSAVLSDIPEVKALNINSLRAECREGSLSSGRCYEMFGAMGVDYGLSYRNLEKLYLGHGKVLARLSLPASLSDTLEQFVMHPGMMDAALQASVGLTAETKELKPSLPFAVQKVEILAGCTSNMWALVKNCKAGEVNKTQKIDVDLCDDEGNVCVRIRGFSTRKTDEFKNEALSDLSECEDNLIDGTVMLAPVWDTIRLNKEDAAPYPTGNVVIAGGTKSAQDAIKEYCPKAYILEIQTGDTIDGIIKNVEALGEIDHIIWISPYSGLKSVTDDELNDGQESGVLQVFRLIKAMLGNGYGIKSLDWTFITTQSQPVGKNDRVNPTHASVCGLVGSMAKEYPNWKVRIADMKEGCKWPVSDILTLPYDPNGNPLAYRGTEWYRQKLIPIDWIGQEGSMYRKGGVYVVIGGAGGIGEVWSEYMIRTCQAKIIWIGRREKDSSIQEKLDRLAAFGPAPCYIRGDAADRDSLQNAYAKIKKLHAGIHGVVHSAIVLKDQSLGNMDEERFKDALYAKVSVCVRIAQVFKDEPLETVMFFSSFQSFTKAPGQSNYASGCVFKDAFAHQLAHEWTSSVKVINWGYWGRAGIVASKAYNDRMLQAGIGSIEPDEAMGALEKLLAGSVDQIAIMKTTKPVKIDGTDTRESFVVYPKTAAAAHNGIGKMCSEKLLKSGCADIDTSGISVAPSRDNDKKEMEELLVRLLWGQLRSIGLLGDRKGLMSALKAGSGLNDIYIKWLEESMLILEKNSYLKLDGDSYEVLDITPSDLNALWDEWNDGKAIWQEKPGMRTQIALVEAVMKALPQILTGKVPATDIIFPGSSMELVEGIYKHNPTAAYFIDNA